VRRLIDAALVAGELTGPDGVSRWSLLRSGPAELSADERALAARLATTPGAETPGGAASTEPET
jgi:hypothetical protein